MEKLYKLFKIQCEDLLVLAEMEYNGMCFNSKGAMEKARELEGELSSIFKTIVGICGNSSINLASDSHISSIIYGGTTKETIRVCVGTYKTGLRQGEAKFRNEEVVHTFDRLVNPIEGTETAASTKRIEKGEEVGHTQWSVGEDVLKKLKAKGKAKEIIELLLKYRGLEKLRGTYLMGWTNLIDKQGWEKDIIHGQLNQCVAVTGRIASSKPNLQNVDKETKKFLISRFPSMSGTE